MVVDVLPNLGRKVTGDQEETSPFLAEGRSCSLALPLPKMPASEYESREMRDGTTHPRPLAGRTHHWDTVVVKVFTPGLTRAIAHGSYAL